MSDIIAFFDIDGTIYREGLITETFKKMIKYEYINETEWFHEVRPAFESWDKRVGDYDTYLLKMIEVYKKTILDIKDDQIEYIAKKVVEQKGDRVYTYTRNMLKWHREQGHKVIAISGSPIELVREMSIRYGMDDYRGTIYSKKPDHTYSGEVVPMWDSKSKKKAILEICERANVKLEDCYAYGDTMGDYTMLSMVGKPVAINPTRELLNTLKQDEEIRKRIGIVVERKDVIYQLDINNLNLI